MTYDENSKKIHQKDLVNFETILKEDTIINDVMDIYMINKDVFITQVFNLTDNKYQLKMFNNSSVEEKDESVISIPTYKEISQCDNENIFEYVHIYIIIVLKYHMLIVIKHIL